jgi:hypothetical protein
MSDQSRLPSAAEALTQAYERMLLGNVSDAEVWIALAREIREGSTPPLITKWLETARPGDRLTLHDVEGIVCAHGRVAVRRKGDDAGRWYLHTDDGSNCADGDAENEHRRRAKLPVFESNIGDEQHRPGSSAKHRPKTLAETTAIAGDLLAGAVPKAAVQTMPRTLVSTDRTTVLPSGSPVILPTFERATDDKLRNRDRFLDYVRGQQDPPSEAVVRLAEHWKAGLDAGHTPPGIRTSDLSDVRFLIDEICHRASAGGHVEDDPAATAQIEAPGRGASGGLCQHCHFEIFMLPAGEVGVPDAYLHTLTGQAVCHVRAGGAVTFATPRDARVASGK